MPKAQPLLLDLFPNASAAYSLRKLRTAYSGNAIRVRRSSDNTEQDIGFINNILDTASLLTFVGANNAFVTRWYDQSTNGFNVVNPSAGQQPQIVISGSVIQENGKPSVYFDGTNDILQVASVGTITNSSIFSTLKIASSTGEDIPFGYGQTNNNSRTRTMYMSPLNRVGFSTWGGDFVSTLSSISTTLYLYTSTQNGTSVTITKNSSLQSGTIATPLASSNLFYCIGSLNGVLINNYYTQMYGSEFIFYPSDQSSNRAAIQSNINSFYTIY
jgi:hypothetical protein